MSFFKNIFLNLLKPQKKKLPQTIIIQGKRFVKIKLNYFDNIEISNSTLLTDSAYQIQKLVSEIEFTNEKLEKVQNLLIQMNNLNINLAFESNELENEIIALKNKIKKLNVELFQYKNEHISFEEDKLNNIIVNLEHKKNELLKEVMTLKIQNEKLKELTEHHKEEKLEMAFDKYKDIYIQKIQRLQEKIDSLQISNSELINKMLKSDSIDLRKIIKLKENEILRLNAAYNELKLKRITNTNHKEKIDSNDLIKIYSEEIRNQDKINHQLREKIEGLEKKINSQK